MDALELSNRPRRTDRTGRLRLAPSAGGAKIPSESQSRRFSRLRTPAARTQFVRQAEQLIDITFPIPDMNTVTGVADKRRGLAQVLQPADALLLCDRHPGRVDLPLQGSAAFKLFTGPKFDGCQSQRQPVQGDSQTAVHEQATYVKCFRRPSLSLPQEGLPRSPILESFSR